MDAGRGKKYPPYYGRGLVQLTWYYNYKKMSSKVGVDLYNNPDLALELNYAIPIMFIGMKEGFFTGKKFADYFNPAKENWVNARRIINGTDRANTIAGRASRPVLRRGSVGGAVGDLQKLLQKLKFPLAIDQDFGAATELAVMRFQGDKKLTVDGIVGKETWDEIEKAVGSTSLSSSPSELLVLDALR
jgi:putative peptidoglycan binding protein/glycosyl hydrolase family 19 (putative chitinase)